MGTRKNRFGEAVITCTHNVCFGQKYTQQKKLRKMCWSSCDTTNVIFHKIRNSYYYEVSFYPSSEGLFEMMTLTEALKINFKVDWSPLHVSQNCHIFRFV